jgi:hypothetical protein
MGGGGAVVRNTFAQIANLASTSFGEGVGTSNFTATTGHFFHYIENGYLVDHNYNITTLKVPF